MAFSNYPICVNTKFYFHVSYHLFKILVQKIKVFYDVNIHPLWSWILRLENFLFILLENLYWSSWFRNYPMHIHRSSQWFSNYWCMIFTEIISLNYNKFVLIIMIQELSDAYSLIITMIQQLLVYDFLIISFYQI